MPLIQRKSKKAFEHNVEAEMHAGKPQDQSLAIAYNVQRKNRKKKMAKGGKVEISAADESRPMPEDQYADSHMDSRVHQKALQKPNWTDDTYSEQASRSFSKSPSDIEIDARDEHMVDIDDQKSYENMMMLRRRKRMAEGGMARQHANELTPSHSYSPHEEAEIEDEAIRMNEEERERDMLAYGGNPKLEESHKLPHGDDDDMIHRIMRKRKRMADGGQVDLSRNADEDQNMEDQYSFEALKKENYSESEGLAQLNQPEDSNEHADEGLEHDEHDMVGSIRKKMRSLRR